MLVLLRKGETLFWKGVLPFKVNVFTLFMVELVLSKFVPRVKKGESSFEWGEWGGCATYFFAKFLNF